MSESDTAPRSPKLVKNPGGLMIESPIAINKKTSIIKKDRLSNNNNSEDGSSKSKNKEWKEKAPYVKKEKFDKKNNDRFDNKEGADAMNIHKGGSSHTKSNRGPPAVQGDGVPTRGPPSAPGGPHGASSSNRSNNNSSNNTDPSANDRRQKGSNKISHGSKKDRRDTAAHTAASDTTASATTDPSKASKQSKYDKNDNTSSSSKSTNSNHKGTKSGSHFTENSTTIHGSGTGPIDFKGTKNSHHNTNAKIDLKNSGFTVTGLEGLTVSGSDDSEGPIKTPASTLNPVEAAKIAHAAAREKREQIKASKGGVESRTGPPKDRDQPHSGPSRKEQKYSKNNETNHLKQPYRSSDDNSSAGTRATPVSSIFDRINKANQEEYASGKQKHDHDYNDNNSRIEGRERVPFTATGSKAGGGTTLMKPSISRSQSGSSTGSGSSALDRRSPRMVSGPPVVLNRRMEAVAEAERELQMKLKEDAKLKAQEMELQRQYASMGREAPIGGNASGHGSKALNNFRMEEPIQPISINAMRGKRESKGDPRGNATAPPEFLRRQNSSHNSRGSTGNSNNDRNDRRDGGLRRDDRRESNHSNAQFNGGNGQLRENNRLQSQSAQQQQRSVAPSNTSTASNNDQQQQQQAKEKERQPSQWVSAASKPAPAPAPAAPTIENDAPVAFVPVLAGSSNWADESDSD